MSRHFVKEHYRNHKSIYKLTIDRRTYKIYTTINQAPYWNEGSVWLQDKNGLYGQERRQYRSWKNTRKTQWKNNKIMKKKFDAL